mmetsp:Transcript_9036/g.25037  ORF Transcript_9036/g.25037 Transcript_9036/m.25037 type:complete len:371 (-) Transcript_9036:284-1396(-)
MGSSVHLLLPAAATVAVLTVAAVEGFAPPPPLVGLHAYPSSISSSSTIGRNKNNNHNNHNNIICLSLQQQESSSSAFLTSEEQRAAEVFDNLFDNDSGDDDDDHDHGEHQISLDDLSRLLASLDITAEPDEEAALFAYLDRDGNGSVEFADEFLPWYRATVQASRDQAATFQALLVGRRTVETFDRTPVSDDVLERALGCAIAAPNRSGSEPWRFIQVGPETVRKLQELNALLPPTEEEDDDNSMESSSQGCTHSKTVDWSTIPGWCVVTTKVSHDGHRVIDDDVFLDDFKSTCCAIQNIMLSLWSEGIGSKWTSGPVQKTPEFAQLVGVDTARERVVGCIWYGFATGGLINADPKRRQKTVDDVWTRLP